MTENIVGEDVLALSVIGDVAQASSFWYSAESTLVHFELMGLVDVPGIDTLAATVYDVHSDTEAPVDVDVDVDAPLECTVGDGVIHYAREDLRDLHLQMCEANEQSMIGANIEAGCVGVDLVIV